MVKVTLEKWQSVYNSNCVFKAMRAHHRIDDFLPLGCKTVGFRILARFALASHKSHACKAFSPSLAPGLSIGKTHLSNAKILLLPCDFPKGFAPYSVLITRVLIITSRNELALENDGRR